MRSARQRCAAVDLRPAGDPGPHVEPVPLPFVVPIGLVAECRPRPDHRHVATHDVPQLWQLVEREPPKDAAGPRDACVSFVDRITGSLLLRSDDHRAELQQLEVLAVPADSGLPVEHGTAIGQLDG